MLKTKRLVTALTLSAFLIAISVVIQRFLVIPFGMPSLYRLSLGNIPIIMASLYLGSVFGAIVGAASDLIGATLFPVGTLIIWPVISSTLYGVVPWLILRLVMYLDRKIKVPLFYVFLAIIFIGLETYIFVKPSIRHPFNSTLDPIMFTTTFRIVFTLVLLLIFSGLIITFNVLVKKYKEGAYEKYTGAPTSLAFTLMLMTFFVDILYSSWWKMFQFKVDFFVSVFFHTLIMFILLPFQVVLLLILSNVYAKSRVAELLALPPKEHIDTDD
ncbi:MAG TPA: ECF transporter S component [Bacilli bacterium]|nr:ECF transporter S component [Bacilli bacterium]HPK29005.1 ECF transporter S component [Bacilli bacterium]